MSWNVDGKRLEFQTRKENVKISLKIAQKISDQITEKENQSETTRKRSDGNGKNHLSMD
jgi:hypothetical protein